MVGTSNKSVPEMTIDQVVPQSPFGTCSKGSFHRLLGAYREVQRNQRNQRGTNVEPVGSFLGFRLEHQPFFVIPNYHMVI
jgi:hypothetical protein